MTGKSGKPRLKVGLLSLFPPEKDSVAQVYVRNLMKYSKVTYVKIGSLRSEADYRLNFKSFTLAKRVARIVAEEKIDVLHVQYIAPHFGRRTFNLNVLPLYSIDVPIVTTLHEVQYPARGGIISMAKKALLGRVEKTVVTASSLVNVHTPKQKAFLEKRYGVTNVSSIVTGLTPKKLHKKHGKRILFFGMLSPQKGLGTLLAALGHLRGYDVRIVGSTPNKACKKYKGSLVERLRPSENSFSLLSKSWFSEEEKEKQFAWADVAVAPYTWGPYHSGAVQDAAEFGIPIVVTKVGAIWELVDAFGLGEIVEAKSASALAGGIEKVFKQYSTYRKGILHYRKHADWKETAKGYDGLYRKAVGNC